MTGVVVHPRSALAGAATALLSFAIGAVVAVAANRSVAVFNGFMVAGCLLGGFRAGLGYPPAPLANGAIAAGAAALPLAVAGVVTGRQVVSAVFGLFVAASLGVFGGLVAGSSNRRRART